jgi:hypothetical protein
MKALFDLPDDPAGYNKFGVLYKEADAYIHFGYDSGQGEGRKIAQLYFPFCLVMSVNAQQDRRQLDIPYDKVVLLEKNVGFDKSFSRFGVWLSGEDVEFDVMARECILNVDVQGSFLSVD